MEYKSKSSVFQYWNGSIRFHLCDRSVFCPVAYTRRIQIAICCSVFLVGILWEQKSNWEKRRTIQPPADSLRRGFFAPDGGRGTEKTGKTVFFLVREQERTKEKAELGELHSPWGGGGWWARSQGTGLYGAGTLMGSKKKVPSPGQSPQACLRQSSSPY